MHEEPAVVDPAKLVREKVEHASRSTYLNAEVQKFRLARVAALSGKAEQQEPALDRAATTPPPPEIRALHESHDAAFELAEEAAELRDKIDRQDAERKQADWAAALLLAPDPKFFCVSDDEHESKFFSVGGVLTPVFRDPELDAGSEGSEDSVSDLSCRLAADDTTPVPVVDFGTGALQAGMVDMTLDGTDCSGWSQSVPSASDR